MMMPFELSELRSIFKRLGKKTVTKTDVKKAAYVLNKNQREVLKDAGFIPGIYPSTTTVPLHVLGTRKTINASFYGSQRIGSGRTPEYIMGKIFNLINTGDDIIFVTDGYDVYICKPGLPLKTTSDTGIIYEKEAIEINEKVNMKTLISRVKKARAISKQRKTTTSFYNRDPAIVAFVRRRADYKCEIPKCKYKGFKKSDGKKYIETHHIISLSEGGEDSVSNCAAVCPNCHRKLHHGKNKAKITDGLKREVDKANLKLGI